MPVAVDATEVTVASSRQEAVDAFGDGSDVTVVAGGTVVVPDLTHGRLRPRRALLLARAGLEGVERAGGRITVGAMTPVAALEALADPLGAAARHVADPEIRAQATLGGNLCCGPAPESPRGDLQAALIALDAQVRSAGAGGERSDDVETALAAGFADRLVLDVSFAEPEAGARAAVRRPHAHAYTVLAVCAARTGGVVRVGVSGAGPHGARCRAVEAALAGGADPAEAAGHALEDVTPADDALASAWYRSQVLPVLVRRALAELG